MDGVEVAYEEVAGVGFLTVCTVEGAEGEVHEGVGWVRYADLMPPELLELEPLEVGSRSRRRGRRKRRRARIKGGLRKAGEGIMNAARKLSESEALKAAAQATAAYYDVPPEALAALGDVTRGDFEAAAQNALAAGADLAEEYGAPEEVQAILEAAAAGDVDGAAEEALAAAAAAPGAAPVVDRARFALSEARRDVVDAAALIDEVTTQPRAAARLLGQAARIASSDPQASVALASDASRFAIVERLLNSPTQGLSDRARLHALRAVFGGAQ